MYWKYLKTHGIPWVLIVYGILKTINIVQNGISEELEPILLLKEVIGWSIAALVYSYLMYYWYYVRGSSTSVK